MTDNRFGGSCALFQYMYLHLGTTCGTGHLASCSRHDPDINVSGTLPRSRANVEQRVSTKHQARAYFFYRYVADRGLGGGDHRA